MFHVMDHVLVIHGNNVKDVNIYNDINFKSWLWKQLKREGYGFHQGQDEVVWDQIIYFQVSS